MAKLKTLVDELVSLNDDNLAQRVIANSDVQWCLSELQDILSTDMEPVQHGMWVWDHADVYSCTCCGRKSHVDEVMERPVWYWCPNCGARMDNGGAYDGG